jgi:hypothetical protein
MALRQVATANSAAFSGSAVAETLAINGRSRAAGVTPNKRFFVRFNVAISIFQACAAKLRRRAGEPVIWSDGRGLQFKRALELSDCRWRPTESGLGRRGLIDSRGFTRTPADRTQENICIGTN